MPAKLVSKRAIIDLGYPFEEDGEVVVIMKALGREHIDEVIQLSEEYKVIERTLNEPPKELTKVYTVAAPPAHSNLREADISTIHSQPTSHAAENVQFTTHLLSSPTVGVIGTNVLNTLPSRPKDERSIDAEIKALEAERDALRSLRKAEQFRREGQGEAVSSKGQERDERRQGKHHEGKHREGKYRESKNREGKHRELKHRSRSKEVTLRKDRKGITPLLASMVFNTHN